MARELDIPTKPRIMKPTSLPLRVVYIAGVGRSGSTVLDSVLGNHPLIQSVGELSRLSTDAWIQNFYCSCGKRSDECPFWSAVRESWCSVNGGLTVQEYNAIQGEVENFHQWPSMLRQSWKDSRAFRVYAEQTLLLLRAIQSVSGCSVIVDSSKAVERALALSLIPDVDLRIIQLVRDPRGVVWSHKKAFAKDVEHGLPRDIRPQPAWRAALYWCRINMHADWLRRRLGPEKALFLRYEDFMLDTPSALKTIGSFVGIDLENVQHTINDGGKLYFDHTIAGNRVRMKGELKLKYDQEWRQKLSIRDQRVTELLTGWLMARYGYKP